MRGKSGGSALCDNGRAIGRTQCCFRPDGAPRYQPQKAQDDIGPRLAHAIAAYNRKNTRLLRKAEAPQSVALPAINLRFTDTSFDTRSATSEATWIAATPSGMTAMTDAQSLLPVRPEIRENSLAIIKLSPSRVSIGEMPGIFTKV